MAGPHEAFKALGPVEWDAVAGNDLPTFLGGTFAEAQCLVDSVPVGVSPSASARVAATTGRPRSHTDSAVVPQLPGRAPQSSDRAQQLRKEWKEVKVNPRENPLGVNVYKLGAKDGRGAWFARRSVHEGLTFERWKLGMEREFAETLKVNGKPGDGNIRGIGAERRVVSQVVDQCGKMEVYHLSAQFPGPTTPRDFVTLLLSSDCAIEPPMQEGLGKARYFMVVSKPCIHPECPQRSGYIRGQYESVELIREIKVEKPLRKVRSSIDLGSEELAQDARKLAVENLGKEAMMRSARQSALASSSSDIGDTRKRGKTIAFAGPDEDDGESESLVEWVMITRSDPGGSVPRFMVEKGTPAGIASDANKFLNWITNKKIEDFETDDAFDARLQKDATEAEELQLEKHANLGHRSSNLVEDPGARPTPAPEESSSPSGFYGMLTGALGIAGSVVSSHLPSIAFGSSKGGDTESELSIDEDSSSIHSFHSLDSEPEPEQDTASPDLKASLSNTTAEAQSTHSSESAAAKSTAPSQHEKDLRKLEERRNKVAEKMRLAQEKAMSKRGEDRERDENAVAKLKEKHDREVAKQEEKYRRDLKKLEDKRVSEQRKAEERRRKQVEREERADLSRQLEKANVERDLALKQIEVLKEQVGELQAQNTKLVARLGKEGINVSGILATGSPSESMTNVSTDRSTTF